MSLFYKILICAFFLGFSCVQNARADARNPEESADLIPCPSIHFAHRIEPSLTEVEKRLICGDPQTEGWKQIPISQAEFVLKGFLQERGYLNPIFTRQNPVLLIEPHEKTKVTSLTEDGGPESFHLERKLGVIGAVLTPSLLGTLEKWAEQELKRTGYACPIVKAEANSDSGAIHLAINPGDLENLVEVLEPQNIAGLKPHVLRRYDAFTVGDPYNSDEVSLSEQRIQNEGTVQSAHYTTSCSGRGAALTLESVAGPPRLFIIGVGFNTEGLLLGKVSLENSRLGTEGSILNTTLYGSTLTQQFDMDFKWYFLPHPSRFYFDPGIDFEHDNEDPYEIVTAQARFMAARTYDYPGIGILSRIGPELNQIRTLRGAGPPTSRFTSLEAELLTQTHAYELNRSNPIDGYMVDLLTDFNASAFLSDESVQKFSVHAEYLVNFKKYDPPLFILGFRTGATTLVSGDTPGPSTLLPQTYLQYLGGSTDLRGYGLKELPVSQIGGMTSFYFDTEGRIASVLPFGVEILLFYDIGFLGNTPFSYNPPLYNSPGFGLRWHSPFGTFRTTLAHGYPSDVDSHFQFYLSFGEEF